jgi:hypothetical protein
VKTRDLISRLQKCDPSGECEVIVGTKDILDVSAEPGYYDGAYELLVRDPALAPYYDVVGGVITYQGIKIVIRPLPIKDAMFDDPDLPVEVRTENETKRAKWAEVIERWRKEARDDETA